MFWDNDVVGLKMWGHTQKDEMSGEKMGAFNLWRDNSNGSKTHTFLAKETAYLGGFVNKGERIRTSGPELQGILTALKPTLEGMLGMCLYGVRLPNSGLDGSLTVRFPTEVEAFYFWRGGTGSTTMGTYSGVCTLARSWYSGGEFTRRGTHSTGIIVTSSMHSRT